MLSKKVAGLFLSLAIATLLFGIIVIIFRPIIVSYQLSSDLILKEGSDALNLWIRRPQFPVHYLVKFYNHSDDKYDDIKYELVGPYKFIVHRTKTNITFINDRIRFLEHRNYSFVPTGE